MSGKPEEIVLDVVDNPDLILLLKEMIDAVGLVEVSEILVRGTDGLTIRIPWPPGQDSDSASSSGGASGRK